MTFKQKENIFILLDLIWFIRNLLQLFVHTTKEYDEVDDEIVGKVALDWLPHTHCASGRNHVRWLLLTFAASQIKN